MTKLELSKNINHVAKVAARTVGSERKLNFVEGEIYDNRGNAESWECDSDSSFSVEMDYGYEYTFIVKDLPCYKVDYDNEEEVEMLSASHGEGEVLVHPSTKMRIVRVATDFDYEEMGYYEIHLELVNA